MSHMIGRVLHLLMLSLLVNGDFFQDYDLNLDHSPSALQKRYEKCQQEEVKSEEKEKKSKSPTLDDVKSMRKAVFHSSINGSSTGNSKKFTYIRKLWPDGRIPLELDPNLSQRELRKVACAIVYFLAYTCVQFTNRNSNDKDYLYVTKKYPTCFTDEIGMVEYGGRQNLNLEESSKRSCWKHRIIVHELMHAVGMFHEHSRLDRNKYIYIHWNNIATGRKFQYYTTYEMGFEQQKDLGKYDFGSIMHYDRFEKDKLAISAKLRRGDYERQYEDNKIMGQKDQPSVEDTRKVNLLYHCSKLMKRKRKLAQIILIAGGGGGRANRSLEYFDPLQPNRNSLVNAKFLTPRLGHQTALLSDGYVLIIGGETYKNDLPLTLATTELFDPETNEIWKGPTMEQERKRAATATLIGTLYICGGSDQNYHSLKSCEKLTRLHGNRWEAIAHMNEERNGLTMTSFNGQIYAIGGSRHFFKYLSSMEIYNPMRNSWKMAKSMPTKRWGLSAAVFDRSIFACGGYNEAAVNVCEKYNQVKNSWVTVAPLKKKEIGYGLGYIALVTLENKLFAIGGGREVRIYDPQIDKWILLDTQLIHERFLAPAVAI